MNTLNLEVRKNTKEKMWETKLRFKNKDYGRLFYCKDGAYNYYISLMGAFDSEIQAEITANRLSEI